MWISVAILCIFLTELAILFLCYLWRFFLHLFYVIDAAVVITSLLLELLLPKGEDVVGVIIIFRFWRLMRVLHGLMTATEHLAPQAFEKEEKDPERGKG